jgi:terminase small subunit-like protein
MAILANRRLEKFAQFCASGPNNPEAYRRLSGRDADVHAAELMARPGVRARVAELQEQNARRAQMTRDELLAFYAEVIRTPADQVPPGGPVIQNYEVTEHGHKIRIVDKAAAGAALAKMTGWNSADRIELGAGDTLSAYLLALRSKPIGGQVIEFEETPKALPNGENGAPTANE